MSLTAFHIGKLFLCYNKPVMFFKLCHNCQEHDRAESVTDFPNLLLNVTMYSKWPPQFHRCAADKCAAAGDAVFPERCWSITSRLETVHLIKSHLMSTYVIMLHLALPSKKYEDMDSTRNQWSICLSIFQPFKIFDGLRIQMLAEEAFWRDNKPFHFLGKKFCFRCGYHSPVMLLADVIWQKMEMIVAAMSQLRAPQQRERKYMLMITLTVASRCVILHLSCFVVHYVYLILCGF